MTSPEIKDLKFPNFAAHSSAMGRIAERAQHAVNLFMKRQSADFDFSSLLHIGEAFMQMTSRLMTDPEKLTNAQLSLWQNYMNLWQNAAMRLTGGGAEPIATPAPGDRRFKNELWQENDVFDFIKQSYLLASNWINTVVHDVDGLDPKTAQKIDFYTRLFIEAMSPANFWATNPEVLHATVESGGENLIKGLENLLTDLERGKGRLAINKTDPDSFKVGENIANTPGKVIYRNELMEIIQYTPQTEQVHDIPVLIVPPWINKFYILDLKPKNSFVRWVVGQGYTVFLISWINPDEKLSHKNFVDYMLDGPLNALDQIELATGKKQVTAVGYCLGGTLLATTLAYMKAHNDDRIIGATYFTTMTDFSEGGEITVFIDEAQIQQVEAKMAKHGYLDGSEMAGSFDMLRANDLIWSFVINNYLMGKSPFPFDLLYWNSDSTRMPQVMHSFYLRNMYQNNMLCKPGGITLNGTPIDLTKIDVSTYMVSAREDHIAPWKSTFAATGFFCGPLRFVLAGSGHIAGIINPPEAQKYCYWTNSRKIRDPEAWLKGAKMTDGSWWPDWEAWLSKLSGPMVAARIPGEGKLPAMEDAPGTYVRIKI